MRNKDALGDIQNEWFWKTAKLICARGKFYQNFTKFAESLFLFCCQLTETNEGANHNSQGKLNYFGTLTEVFWFCRFSLLMLTSRWPIV